MRMKQQPRCHAHFVAWAVGHDVIIGILYCGFGYIIILWSEFPKVMVVYDILMY